jgi:hypothetical protein
VLDAGIREISESHSPEIVSESETTSNMKWNDIKTKFPEAVKAIQESLTSKGTSLEDIKATDESFHADLRKMACESLEPEIQDKLLTKFDDYCESIREDITAEEISEAVASEFAAFLVEHGVDESLAAKISGKPEVLGKAISEACKTFGPELNDTPTAPAKGAVTEGLTAAQAKEIAESQVNEVKTDLDEKLEALQAQLDEAKKETAIAKLEAAFPYKKEIFEKNIRPLLDECLDEASVEAVYNSSVDLVKASGAQTVKTGSSKFIAGDSQEVDEATKAAQEEETRLANRDRSQIMIDEAAASLKASGLVAEPVNG